MNWRPAELAWVAHRRRWWLIAPAALGLGAGLLGGQLLPPVYRASTLIMAEQQRLPNDYVKATVTTSLQDRLKSIEQQVVSRENLLELIDAMKLYPQLRESPPEAAVERARRDITIQMLGQTTFRIYYRGAAATLVADTANRIAEQFIRDTLAARERQARTTSSFLETELDAMRLRLEEQEDRIAQFKQAHLGQLPEQREAIFRSIEQLQAKLRINFDSADKLELKGLILRGNPEAAATEAPPDAPRRLALLRQELADLRARYTDLHPDVIRTQAAIERVEDEIAAAPAALVAPAPATAQTELEALREQQRLLGVERQRILAAIAANPARLENIPRVEQELLILTRDYENIESSYRSLLSKGIDARLAENLEKRRQDEQFTVLERAVPPAAAYFPNPFLFAAAGLLLGGGVGAGLALLREQADQTYAGADELRRDFPAVPLLATVPLLGSDVRLGRGYYPEDPRVQPASRSSARRPA